MKALIGCVAIIFALATVSSADAKGCIKGAVIGGATAGEYLVAFDTQGITQREAKVSVIFDQQYFEGHGSDFLHMHVGLGQHWH